MRFRRFHDCVKVIRYIFVYFCCGLLLGTSHFSIAFAQTAVADARADNRADNRADGRDGLVDFDDFGSNDDEEGFDTFGDVFLTSSSSSSTSSSGDSSSDDDTSSSSSTSSSASTTSSSSSSSSSSTTTTTSSSSSSSTTSSSSSSSSSSSTSTTTSTTGSTSSSSFSSSSSFNNSSSSSFSSSSSGGGSGGGSGASDLNFLNGLLGGVLGSILGQLGLGGLLGGGLGGLGGGGNFPNGDVNGTPGGLYGNLTDMSKLFPGDPNRSVQGEECEEGAYANGNPGDLTGGDTQVLSWQGNSRQFNGNVGQGVANALGSKAPAKTYGPGGQGSAQDFINDVGAAAQDTSGKKYVLVFNCHGSPGSPGNWEGGLNTQSLKAALDQGGSDLSHITIVDGACFPCRGPYLASQQMAQGKTPINHVRAGQHQNRVQYYNPATGNSFTVTNFVNAVEQYLNGGGTRNNGNRLAGDAFGFEQRSNVDARRGNTIILTTDILIGAAYYWAYPNTEQTRNPERIGPTSRERVSRRSRAKLSPRGTIGRYQQAHRLSR